MNDDFFVEKKRKRISITAVLIAIVLIAVLSSSVVFFFVPTLTVDEKDNDKQSVHQNVTYAPDVYIPVDESSFTKVYEENCDTVVILDAYVEYDGKSVHYTESSGFIISSDGYILTNSHCVVDVDSLKVTLYNGNTYDATIIGYDERTEVAVIKIDAKEELKVAKLGNSDGVKIGSYAIAIGNPMGYEFSMSVGYISGVQRTVNSMNYRYKMLQMDIAINSGNSGGPLFNMAGEVIGINTMKKSSTSSSAIVEGMGFAIPINVAKEISSQLIKDGKVTRAALEITVGNNTSEIGGVLVAEVVKDGASHKAGMLAGDIIIGFKGVTIYTVNDLMEQLDYCKPGDTVEVTVVREDKEHKLNVILGTA